MGTGLHIGLEPASEEQIQELFDGPEATEPASIPEPGPDFETAFEAPKSDAGNFDYQDFAHFDAPKTATKSRKTLGPDDKEELAEFFTKDGIGSIVARGLNAFFKACDAEQMSVAESNNVAQVTAYYCRARLPKGAGAYQPELLLFATLAMAILPRMGPIAEKTAPFWTRAWERARGFFQRKE